MVEAGGGGVGAKCDCGDSCSRFEVRGLSSRAV